MATVYLADDLKHERKVALKVLKPELAAVVGAERFLAEIKTTAKLQHPHILPLFDSGETENFLFYVMPYVEGESLREKIEREHQLPVDEAVSIATDMAEALDYAHRQGVIHRDIKPGNVLIHDGQPVISDFGIALAVGVAGGGRLTETGLSLGTPHYMSPEQATGDQTVARATDIYALGAVLYEMLVGDPPYMGSTAQAVLGRIIAGELASATKQRASVPANVDAAIRKALEKLPADRFTGAQEFARALADPGFGQVEEVATPVPRRGLAWQGAALLGIGMLLGVVGVSVWSAGGEDTAADVMRFTIDPPEGAPLGFSTFVRDLAISPDGRQIAYNGGNPGGTAPQLNLRTIDQLVGAPLRGGEGGLGPFFSPDGEWVGFVPFNSRTTLQKVSTFGGPPVTLVESPSPIFGSSWGPDDQIIFGTGGGGGGLFRVSGGGGESEPLTILDPEQGEAGHLWPSIIADREAVVFVIGAGNPLADGQLAVLDLSTGEITRLGLPGTSPHYVSTGHLVYAAEDGSLRAVPFDAGALEVTGNPVPLVEGVAVKASGAADFSIADNGRLIYALGAASGGGVEWEFLWVDRQGREELLPMPAQRYDVPKVSPDGRRIAVGIQRAPARDLWVYDAATGAGLRLTRDDEVNRVPMWTPDGERVLFSSTKDAPRPESFTGAIWLGNIYGVPADGSSEAERLTTTDENQGLTGISPDGQTLVYSRVIENAHWEVMATPADGSADGTALVSGPFRQGGGTIAPNGRWLAYKSDETGQFEIYVEPFPGPGAKVPVPIGGGIQPAWSRDGRELFYRDNDGTMIAATISDGATPPVGDRTPLFSAAAYRLGGGFLQYHVAPDGRCLMQRRPGAESADGGGATDHGRPQLVRGIAGAGAELRSVASG